MDNRVSLVIPTYNRKHTLEKVIDSYLRQKSLKEIVFVIDGSTDGTLEYVEGLQAHIKSPPIIKIEKHQKRRGVSHAKNTGIKAATGDYILMGEDDVILREDYIATLLECMEETGVDIIAGRILYSKKNETIEETIRRCNNSRRKLINYWAISVLNSVPIAEHLQVPFFHALGLGRAEVFKKILYNPDYHAREETDFYIRAGKEGAKLILCPHTMCFHLPQDRGRGGGWSVGVFRFQYLAIKGNNMLVDQHYAFLKKWGMKGNKMTFKLLHLLNRIRILYLYFRYSVKQAKL